MKPINSFYLKIPSRSANESFARFAVSAFVSQLDPTLEELSDIKTAVSEAVTNSIVHAYKNEIGNVYITAEIYENRSVKIRIRDTGCGIDDVNKALEPLFTTVGGERSGLGFSVMQSFMDYLKVSSKPNKGTTVIMKKVLSIKI
ncbi:MAG: anti-sigma F factor [Clostridia bacterium]|nr:anti-sigma F factor [Clostridia bacterium]MBQ4130718.1 anti-sigma F factor [Clostridia bacterium]MBQ7107541.1 anti-sigma F factor [Clostridia bacterium]MBQ9919464.1 anti-sigma F factor [Clostridia bacterium]